MVVYIPPYYIKGFEDYKTLLDKNSDNVNRRYVALTYDYIIIFLILFVTSKDVKGRSNVFRDKNIIIEYYTFPSLYNLP